jgi:hypothetical protein
MQAFENNIMVNHFFPHGSIMTVIHDGGRQNQSELKVEIRMDNGCLMSFVV